MFFSFFFYSMVANYYGFDIAFFFQMHRVSLTFDTIDAFGLPFSKCKKMCVDLVYNMIVCKKSFLVAKIPELRFKVIGIWLRLYCYIHNLVMYKYISIN